MGAILAQPLGQGPDQGARSKAGRKEATRTLVRPRRLMPTPRTMSPHPGHQEDPGVLGGVGEDLGQGACQEGHPPGRGG